MRVALYGGDQRYARAAEWLQRAGHSAWLGFAPEDCGLAQVVVLPAMPDDDTFRILSDCAPDAVFLLQRGPAVAARTVSLASDEAYQKAVAYMTAEGAVHAFMGLRERSLYGVRCAVYGYGRLGRALIGILNALGACCTVIVRPGPSALHAASDDMSRCAIGDEDAVLREAEIVWNTVPAPVLPPERLVMLPQEASVIDLASAPYGFDLPVALAAGVKARRMAGVPGAYCPDSAGRELALAILRSAGEGDNVWTY